MIKLPLGAISGISLFAVAAFAAPAMAQDQSTPPGATPPGSTAPSSTEPGAAAPTGKVPTPPAGKGQIVFFRPWAYPGMAVSFSIHEGDKGVVKLGNNSYAILTEDPGKHAFSTESEAKDNLTLEVDDGETYYVQEILGMGLLLYRPELTPSDQATFDKHSGLHLSTQKPTDLKPSTDTTTPAAGGTTTVTSTPTATQ